jgi:hypothetical protein
VDCGRACNVLCANGKGCYANDDCASANCDLATLDAYNRGVCAP